MAALENNNLGMSNSEDQAVTENQVDQSLDLSTADSPLDPLNDKMILALWKSIPVLEP